MKLFAEIYVDFAGYAVDITNIATMGQRIANIPQYGLYQAEGTADGSLTLNLQGQAIDNAQADATRVAVGQHTLVKENGTQVVPLSALNNPAYRFGSTAAYNQIKALLSKHYLQLP